MKDLRPLQYIRLAWVALLMSALAVACSDDKGGASAPLPPVVAPLHHGSDDFGSYSGKYLWDGPFTVNNQSVYNQFMEDHNVCSNHGLNFGTWKCKNYTGIRVNIALDRLELPSTGFAQIYSAYQGQHLVLPPSYFHGHFKAVDADSGMELYRRGYDFSPTYNAILRYRIAGLPTDPESLALEFYYRNQLLGTGTIKRIR